MVRGGDREAPARATEHAEPSGVAGSNQRVARVAPDMAGPLIARAEPRGMGGYRQHGDARRPQHAPCLDQRRNVVVHVLDYLSEDDRIEARVRKREGSGIRPDDPPANTLGQDLARRRRDVRAHDLEAALLEQLRERSLTRADVENPRPGEGGQKELQEQPLA
jgi:hypothetical protein